MINSSNRNPLVKVELMHPNMEVYDSITSDISNTDGSIKINFQNGIRRSASITINNVDKKYKVSPTGGIWLDTMFRLYTGYYIKGEYKWFLQGTFCISNASMSDNPDSRNLTIEGLDRMAKLTGDLGGVLSAVYYSPSGQSVRATIEAILLEAGDTSPIVFSSAFEADILPYSLTSKYGDTYYSILKELAGLRSANFFYDEYGCFNFVVGIENISDAIKPSMYSFSSLGDDVNYISSTCEFQFSKLRNSAMVIGSNTDGNIHTAVTSITDPTSYVRTDLVGVRLLEPIEDDNINTDAYALERANYELAQNGSLTSVLTINCIPIPHLNINQVIDITNDVYDFDHKRYLIQTIDYPLSTSGLMTLTCANILSSAVISSSTSEASQLISLIEDITESEIDDTPYIALQKAICDSYNESTGIVTVHLPADTSTFGVVNVSGKLIQAGHTVLLLYKNGSSLSTAFCVGDLDNLGTTVITNNVVTETLYSTYGDIVELTVDQLMTGDKVFRYLDSDTSDINYIKIQDQTINFITGTTDGSTEQHVNRDGDLLYWNAPATSINYKTVGMTTATTAYPVTIYKYTELTKMSMKFILDNGTYIPVWTFGAGDGVTENSGKAFVYKATDGLELNYYTPNDAELRQIKLGDEGITMTPFPAGKRLLSAAIDKTAGTVTVLVEDQVAGDETVIEYTEDSDSMTFEWPDGFSCTVSIS